MADVKNLAIVTPSVTLVKDGEGNTVRGDYHYPVAPGCTAHVLCYNRDKDPNGDFLLEQMWSISGPQEGLDVFFADPRVTKITKDQARSMGVTWDGEKQIPDSINPNTSLYCPDCGMELECPAAVEVCPTTVMGPGKAPTGSCTHAAWDPDVHAHHIDDALD